MGESNAFNPFLIRDNPGFSLSPSYDFYSWGIKLWSTFCGSLAFLSPIHWVIPNNNLFWAETTSFLNQLIFLRWNFLGPDWQVKESYLPTWAWTFPWKHWYKCRLLRSHSPWCTGGWCPMPFMSTKGLFWAQGEMNQALVRNRHLSYMFLQGQKSASSSTRIGAGFHRMRCMLFVLLQWKSVGHLFDKFDNLMRLDKLCYNEGDLALHLTEKKRITDKECCILMDKLNLPN